MGGAEILRNFFTFLTILSLTNKIKTLLSAADNKKAENAFGLTGTK
jgi:hypothetical protein